MGTSNLNAMLQAVKFPAGIADLNPGLTNVDGDALSHCGFETGDKMEQNLEEKEENGKEREERL